AVRSFTFATDLVEFGLPRRRGRVDDPDADPQGPAEMKVAVGVEADEVALHVVFGGAADFDADRAFVEDVALGCRFAADEYVFRARFDQNPGVHAGAPAGVVELDAEPVVGGEEKFRAG